MLLVDDEADQASFKHPGEEKAGEHDPYRRLKELRGNFPNQTYLQYTATPQAPLLISIDDLLSPNFVHVLQPGDNYVGGKDFFQGDCSHIRVIPPEDITGDEVSPDDELPETLKDALRVFLIGVTIGILRHDSEIEGNNRSMLIHPSRLRIKHKNFCDWVEMTLENWEEIFKLDDVDQDRKDLVDEFHNSYIDLKQTVTTTSPTFDELLPYFFRAIRNTRVKEVNTRDGKTPRIDWAASYSWILVGGKSMDRGFTVEGLTVTYMPRGVGIGHADALQQRARFFGYKKSYFEFCRIYVEESTKRMFQDYVKHEEDMHKQLSELQNNQQPLSEWIRRFVFSPALKPCRQQVLKCGYLQGVVKGWSRHYPKADVESVDLSLNKAVVEQFLQGLEFHEDKINSGRTPYGAPSCKPWSRFARCCRKLTCTYTCGGKRLAA